MEQKEFEEKYSGRLKDIQDVNDLPKFLEEMLKDADDYGSIVSCISYGAIATAWTMNHHPNGGITGFQASFIMWEFIKQWMYSNNKCGLKIVDYDDFLYPQREERLNKTISLGVWKLIQKQAQEKLVNSDACEEVTKHWQNIVDGVVPFGYEIEEE